MEDINTTDFLQYDKIYNGNCEEVMKRIPDKSIDLIVTSPPYADQRSYGKDVTIATPDNYLDWFKPMAKQIKRVLKDTGNFILNINDKVVDGEQSLYVFKLVIYLCEKLGFRFVRDYIWYNPATAPNIYSTGKFGRTKKSHEYCFWFSVGEEWTFNLDPIRRPYGPDMLKYLEGKGKGNRRTNTRPSTHNFNCEKVWNDNGGSDPGSVIEIANTSSNDAFFKQCKELGITHPARFPIKLAEFFIKAGSNEGDVVLDPFSGSGTTCVAADGLRRHWIGIDANMDYCQLSLNRIKAERKDRERNEKKASI